jgi:hypothetical protein
VKLGLQVQSLSGPRPQHNLCTVRAIGASRHNCVTPYSQRRAHQQGWLYGGPAGGGGGGGGGRPGGGGGPDTPPPPPPPSTHMALWKGLIKPLFSSRASWSVSSLNVLCTQYKLPQLGYKSQDRA